MQVESAVELEAMLAPLRACAAGELPPNVALTRALACASSETAFERVLRIAMRSAQAEAGDAYKRLRELEALWIAHPEALQLVHMTLQGLDHSGNVRNVAYWRGAFDRLARTTPDAGVALYTLGDAAIAAAASMEITRWLVRENLIGRTSRVLDLGCGAGRMLQALAPEIGWVVGAEISEAMAREATKRTRNLTNVTVVRTSGRDLACFTDAAFDAILAVDSFPYLVLAGAECLARHFAEAARVLRPGGTLTILNYSYRGDPQADRGDVMELARVNGLSLLSSGTKPFTFWDGAAFVVKKAG